MNRTPIALVNTSATFGAKGKQIAENTHLKTMDITHTDFLELLKSNLKQGNHKYLICGGDGTINWFLNCYMHLTKKQRQQIIIGIIPCGRANDLARQIGVPLNIKKAIDYSIAGAPKAIDIVKVNSKYFITGGSLGLPSEVIQDMNRDTQSNLSNRLFKDLTYYYVVLKKMLLGYAGVEIRHVTESDIQGQHMLLSVTNQSFIGKRFQLSPDSINDDGTLELCAIKKPSNPIQDLRILHKVIRGQHIKTADCMITEFTDISIQLKRKEWFMGDGELLAESKTFDISVLPKALQVLHSPTVSTMKSE